MTTQEIQNPHLTVNDVYEDWQHEVANGDTRRSYDEWVMARAESEDYFSAPDGTWVHEITGLRFETALDCLVHFYNSQQD